MSKMSDLHIDYSEHIRLCSKNNIEKEEAWVLLDTNIKNVVYKEDFLKDYSKVEGEDKMIKEDE